jgi:hypothetical protein
MSNQVTVSEKTVYFIAEKFGLMNKHFRKTVEELMMKN